MDSKRGAISFVFIIAFVIFSISLISADHCEIQQGGCSDPTPYQVMRLSDDVNAHGELLSQAQYISDWYLCCSFDGTNNCENGNKIVGLSSSTNAHAQIPSLNSYTSNVCYSNLLCQSFTQDPPCPLEYPIFTLYLTGNTNAHLAGSEEITPPTTPPTGYGVIICCQANVPSQCGNGILDAGEACDDGNSWSGDGCSYPDCQVEPGCDCTYWTSPMCCWCTPTSHWYLNGVPQAGVPNYFGIRLNDILTMRFDENFCMNVGDTRTFSIIEGATTRGTATATVSSGGYTEATYGPVQQPFLTALGIGNSDIFFRMLDPWYGNQYDSYSIRVVPKYCGDGTCEAVDGETCSSCSLDCKCPANCACPLSCGNNILEPANGEECDEGDTNNNDGCSSTCQIEHCGDGITQTNEQCDDGNLVNGDGCSSTCQIVLCPNGVINPGETCSTCPQDVGPCCGNGVINSGEDCDSGNLNNRDCTDVLGDNDAIGNLACFPSGTSNECQFDSSGCSIPGVCTINNAAWSATEVDAGTYVDLNIETSNCDNGEEITFVVEEVDGFLNPSDSVNNEPLPATVNGNIATGSWRAEYQDDTDGGQDNPPEYTFTATITSSNGEMESSNLLIVNEIDATCIGITYCGDYTNEADCVQDTCTVDYGFASGFCGAFFNPETRCMDLTNCSCSWNTNTNTCEAGWNREHLCGTCGNGVTDFGEECDDGNNVEGDGCSSTCQFEDNILPPCPYGTTLCSDLTCSKNCYSTDTSIATCTIDGVCNVGTESCNCLDCQGVADTCAAGLICTIFNVACCNSESDGICDPECSYVDPDCENGYCGDGYSNTGEQCDDGNNVEGDGCSAACELEILTPSCCPEGTAECTDTTCSLNCYATDTSIIQTSPNCCSPLVFSAVDQACCNPTSDGYCNPYCHYSDPDCIVIPPQDLDSGLCTYTDTTTDNCDDYILFRSLAANWEWAVGNNYITNPTNDYWWDAECNAGAGCYRYDPLNYLGTLREHEECAPVQDNIACPEQIQIGMQILYSLIAAIVLIVIIYLIFFSRKKKKSHSNRKK
jgi:cysteine-rich repeat protein